MENDFNNVKINDRVFHITYGWGTVSETNLDTFGVVFTDKNNRRHTSWFYFNGKIDHSHQNPSVFWDEVKIIPPPKPKRKVEKTIEAWLNFYLSDSLDTKMPIRFYSYLTKEKADEMCHKDTRIGEAYHAIHKYTIEE